MKTYGIDAHSDNLKILQFSKTEKAEFKSKKIRVTLHEDSLSNFLDSLTKEDYVALEASTNSFYLYDLIKPRVKACFVLDPWKMPEIYKSPVKTDFRDAEKIADRLLTAVLSPDLLKRLPVVYVPDTTIRKLRSLFTSLRTLKKIITQMKNSIHAVIKNKGKLIPRKSIDYKNVARFIDELQLEEAAVSQVTVFLDLIKETEKKCTLLEDEIKKTGASRIKEIDILTSTSGVSVLGALAMIADYADVHRFASHKRFCSYLRSAPGIEASNKTVHIKSINKCSRKVGILYLVQGFNHIKNSSRKLKSFHERKRNGKSAGKVRMAIIRKTMVAMYYMLQKNEYHYFRNEELHKKKMDDYRKFLKTNGLAEKIA